MDSATDALPQSKLSRSLSPRRKIALRVAAVGAGLSIVLALEMFCRVAGWGDPRLQKDPFVGFAGTRPLFVLSGDGESYVIPRVRDDYFARDSFPVEKPPGSMRVFCLGGSTVQGRPYSIATSFTTWLELALNVADESREWDLVNCGGISYASYRLVPILEECLQYEPDLIILCTGHNEFLEDRSYPPITRSALVHRVSELRLVNVMRAALQSSGLVAEDLRRAPRSTLPLETEPILNFNGGLAVYHRDDAWRQGVVDHYEWNVRRMVEMARAVEVPVLLMKPCSNLEDCPPFKSEPSSDMRPEEVEQWAKLIEQARELRESDPVEALQLLEQALTLDEGNALTHFELGRVHFRLKDLIAARAAFVRARDLDVCPLRMTSALEQRMESIAEQEGVPYLDLDDLLEQFAPDGILGDEELVDHIHPSIENHRRIAQAVALQLQELGLVNLKPGWKEEARAAFDIHFAGLDSAYFLRGQRMLDGLRAWAQGRADGPPAAEHFPGRTQERWQGFPEQR